MGIYYEKDLKQLVALSIIICIGLFGNSLNIIVFSHRSMRMMSTFQFLLYLSIIDLFVLLICSSDALLTYGLNYEIRLYSDLVCKMHTFFTYFLTHMSSILLMVVSIERVLVVYNKTFITFFLRRSEIRNMKRKSSSNSNKYSIFKIFIHRFKRLNMFTDLNRVTLIMICITLFLALINAHYLFYLNINLVFNSNNQIDLLSINYQYSNNSYKDMSEVLLNKSIDLSKKNAKNYSIKRDVPVLACFPQQNTAYHYFLTNIFIWFDISIYSLMPFLIMFLCTILILIEMRKKTAQFTNNVIKNRPNKLNRRISQKRTRKNNQILILMLTTNAYFIICSLPYFILYFTATDENSDKNSTVLFANILAYSNNAFNFILFGIFSHKYRQTLMRILRLKSKPKYSISLVGRIEENNATNANGNGNNNNHETNCNFNQRKSSLITVNDRARKMFNSNRDRKMMVVRFTCNEINENEDHTEQNAKLEIAASAFEHLHIDSSLMGIRRTRSWIFTV
jgi:hypothetical protein